MILSQRLKRVQQGNVLLSTILIMGLALNIGLVIAFLSLGGFNRTKNIKSQALSYYAAESGTEASLYKVRRGGTEIEKLGINPVGICSNDLATSCSNDSDCGTNSNCLYNIITETGTSWQAKGQITTPAIQEDLEKDRSLVFYFYNPEDWQSGLSSLQIKWDDTCQNLSALDIEQFYPITNQAQLDNLPWEDGENNTLGLWYVRESPNRNASDVIANDGSKFIFLNPALAYAIKITARNCYVNFLEVKGLDESGNAVNLNLESIITTTGSIGNVKQTIKVSM